MYTYGDPGHDPHDRIETVAFLAMFATDDEVVFNSDVDAALVGWVPVDKLPTLPFDHADIVSYTRSRLRYMLEFSAEGFRLFPQEFRLNDVQRL